MTFQCKVVFFLCNEIAAFILLIHPYLPAFFPCYFYFGMVVFFFTYFPICFNEFDMTLSNDGYNLIDILIDRFRDSVQMTVMLNADYSLAIVLAQSIESRC